MSNTKTKMKTGTIAVIALSIVLVLSLITTITLAYFTATRQVVTTIRFADGVWMQMGGVYTADANNYEDTPASQSNIATPVYLYWNADYADTTSNGHVSRDTAGQNLTHDNYSTYINVDNDLLFDEVLVRVVKTSAYVAMKVVVYPQDTSGNEIALSSLDSYQAPAMADGWKAMAGGTDQTHQGYATTLASAGWFMYTGAGNTAVRMTAPASYQDSDARYDNNDNPTNSYVRAIQPWTVPANDSFAGKRLVTKIFVFAATSFDGLLEVVNTANDTGGSAVDDTATAANRGYATAYVAPAQQGG